MDNAEYQVAAHCVGAPKSTDFRRVAVAAVEATADAPLVVQLVHVSVDPYMRGRMSGVDSYAPAWKIGSVPEGGCIARVIESRDEGFAVGDIVTGMFKWRFIQAVSARAVRKIPAELLAGGVPSSAFIGALGMTGLTALMPIQRFGDVKPGQVAFVSGGAGAVGTVVVQILKSMGVTVIASAGSEDKVALLRELGADHAFNYKTTDTLTALRAAAPAGLNLFYDNVGGETLDAALEAMARGGRIILCGAISQYNAVGERYGVKNTALVIGKSLSIFGFIISDWIADWGAAIGELVKLFLAGKIRHLETVRNGFDAIPAAFAELFTGGNTGKMVVTL